jgi:hypothetical protein
MKVVQNCGFYTRIRKGYTERSIIRPQHVDKGELNDTLMYSTQ